MTPDAPAIRIALDLLHVPSQVRAMRDGALPRELDTVLKIASGDDDVLHEISLSMQRTRADLTAAAEFFVEQVLFAPDADHYRVLGAKPDATQAELRRNMALLLKWLHPDIERKSHRSIFAGRVTAAWNTLKSDERRKAYDASRTVKAPSKRSRRSMPAQRAHPALRLHTRDARPGHGGILVRAWARFLGKS